MLVNGNAVLEKALKEGYAVPAYNINNLEWTRYILETCQEDKSPVILAVTEKVLIILVELMLCITLLNLLLIHLI